MAAYMPKSENYSLLDNAQFKSGFENTQPAQPKAEQEPYFNKDTKDAALSGARAGGLSGALINGGVTSMLGSGGMAAGGPYAVAGGLILSQIEEAKQQEAQAEQDRIANEKNRRANMMAQYNNMANQTFKV